MQAESIATTMGAAPASIPKAYPISLAAVAIAIACTTFAIRCFCLANLFVGSETSGIVTLRSFLRWAWLNRWREWDCTDTSLTAVAC